MYQMELPNFIEMEDTAVSTLIIMSSPMFQISKPNPPTLSRLDGFWFVRLKMVAV